MEASTIKLNKIWVSLILPMRRWLYFSVLCLFILFISIVLLR